MGALALPLAVSTGAIIGVLIVIILIIVVIRLL